MAEHPDVALVRRGYEAFVKGDLETVKEVLADDIEWHVTGRSPLAGVRHSKDEVFEFFGELIERSSGTHHLEVHDIVGGDENVVVILTEHAERNGRTLAMYGAHLWKIRDGKAVEFWGLLSEQQESEEFWF